VTGSKLERAKPVSSLAEAGFLKIVQGGWNQRFLEELNAFPTPGVHDDQTDALSGAHEVLAQARRILLA
jgi:predicted phage terminase large subunit-like protein